MSNDNVKKAGSPSKAGFDVNPQNINMEGGTEKELTYAELIKQVGEQESKYKAKKQRKTVAVEAQWDKAEKGDNQSFNTLLDRLEGKAKQGVEIGGVDGNPVVEVRIRMI